MAIIYLLHSDSEKPRQGVGALFLPENDYTDLKIDYADFRLNRRNQFLKSA